MKSYLSMTLILAAFFLFAACNNDDETGPGPVTISSINFLDELVIPDAAQFQSTTIGGLSGIDYHEGNWYMISDDANAPIRAYRASIDLSGDRLNSINFNQVITLRNTSNASFSAGTVDPEGLRFDAARNELVWISEGNINGGEAPQVYISNPDGSFINTLGVSARFSGTNIADLRHNGTFESISTSVDGDGFWVGMELPLVSDGEEPQLSDTQSPVRITYVDRESRQGQRQFAYELDPIAEAPVAPSTFAVNGLVELLQYDADRFLALERSFATGHADGGNTVKIYLVDASGATDVLQVDDLTSASYTAASKILLFDFESVRSQLTDGIVDNIEGITYGPQLENGKQSLVLVADNNFSAFGPQLNQLVLFEINP